MKGNLVVQEVYGGHVILGGVRFGLVARTVVGSQLLSVPSRSCSKSYIQASVAIRYLVAKYFAYAREVGVMSKLSHDVGCDRLAG